MRALSTRSTWLPVALGLAVSTAAGRIAEAAPQGSAFPIANTPMEEFGVGSAFDGTNFMVAIQGDALDHSHIGAQRVSPAGTLVGPLISTGRTGGAPLIAFGATDYLLAWTDDETSPDNHIYGQLISPQGTQGSLLPISLAVLEEDIGGVAAGPGGFLVTYDRETVPATGNGHVYGRIVTDTGTIQPEVQISTALSWYDDSSVGNVAGDGAGYLVAWVDGQNRHQVRGRLVDASGSAGLEIVISDTPAQSDLPVTVDFNGTNYLVAFHEHAIGPAGEHWDIHAQLVSPAGALVGGPIEVTTEAGDQVFPCIGTDGGLWLVTWTDLRNDVDGDWTCDPEDGTCADLYAQYIDPAGALVGDEWPLIQLVGDQLGSVVTPGLGQYLLLYNEAVLPMPPVGGDVYGKFVPQDGGPHDYCTAKVNSKGCEPDIWLAGIPSATDTEPCTIGCDLVLNNQFGLMLYGYKPHSIPFQGGTLCIHAPHKRTPVQHSGGNPPPSDCSGTYALDFNAWIQSGVDPNLVPGQSVYAQYWYRDPLGSTYPSGLSNATSFDIQP